MEEKNFKNYKFMVPMYGWPVDVYYGNPSDVREHLANKYGVEFDTFDDYCNGYTGMMEKCGKKHKEINMFFFINDSDKFGYWDKFHTVHHEAIHTAWFILDYVGIKIKESNHEALTYLEGYIARKVCEQIDAWKKQ